MSPVMSPVGRKRLKGPRDDGWGLELHPLPSAVGFNLTSEQTGATEPNVGTLAAQERAAVAVFH